ncbi:MAG: hypothetical protein OSJ65_04245 [Bacilli bacterium]|nr:hypothetical protein [Bacilli bacterium]
MIKKLLEYLRKYTSSKDVLNICDNLDENNLETVIDKYKTVINFDPLVDRSVLDKLIINYIEKGILGSNNNLVHLMDEQEFLFKIKEFTQEDVERIIYFTEKESSVKNSLHFLMCDKELLKKLDVATYFELLILGIEYAGNLFFSASQIIKASVKRDYPISYIKEIVELIVKNSEKEKIITEISTNDNFNLIDSLFWKLTILRYIIDIEENDKLFFIKKIITNYNVIIRFCPFDILTFVQNIDISKAKEKEEDMAILFDFYTLDEVKYIINERLLNNQFISRLIFNLYFRQFLSLEEIMHLYYGLELNSQEKIDKFLELIYKHQDILPKDNLFQGIVALCDYESYTKTISDYMKNYQTEKIYKTLQSSKEKIFKA